MKQDVGNVFPKEIPSMTKFKLIFSLWLISKCLTAQNEIPIGSWRTHFSYRDACGVALTENGVFCAGSNSLFFLDFQDQSLSRVNKINGLSDSEISAIAYNLPSKKLVIAYGNGNIDLLYDNKITNITTILQSPIAQSKTISHITFTNNLAYLSAGFGVGVLDLNKDEITEAFTNIGENGTAVEVNFGTVFHDTLFLATEQGVIGGSLDPTVNLQDFNNWKRFDSSLGIPNLAASTVGSSDDLLIATVDDGIYSYSNTVWDKIEYELSDNVLHITSGSNPLFLTSSDQIVSIGNDLEVNELLDSIFPKPQSSIVGSDGLWIADSINGLIVPQSGQFSSIFPSGPFSDSIFHVFNQGNLIFALPPGFDFLRKPLRTTLGFNTYENGEWTNFNSSKYLKTELFPAVNDLVDVTYNPRNQSFYFASYGEGIVEWSLEGNTRILDETSPGSTLKNIPPVDRNVLISSITADNAGMVWATNFGNQSSIHRFNPVDDSWTEFWVTFPTGRFPLDLKIADNGDLWLRLDPNNGGGVLVFNPQSSLQKHLTNIEDSGGLPSREIRDLTIDNNGQIWMGTDIGVSTYLFPFDILENPVVNASSPLIDGRPLLRDEVINCIAVDGGNRKWIGTNDGIWLFSEHGDSVVQHFTVENSPLPSNKILDVEVNGGNGEVFIVTAVGTVSYRGTATDGPPEHQQVSIFPNPVTRDFNGLVGITGLVNNAVIKIADVTGKLIKETAAKGGTAVWDIADFQGRRVATGVYLVFSSSSDGKETFIGKIAVIN